MPTVTPHIFKASLTVLVLLCLGAWIVLSGSKVNADPEDYDTNDNGILEKNEVISVVVDYFQDKITKDEVLGVLLLYFLNAPESTPAPAPTPIPTATPTTTPTPVPEPTQTPTASQEDLATPELVEVTLSVSELDVSSGSGVITVTTRATDDLSGISHVELAFESPSGEQEERMSASVPTTGTFNDGVYVDTMTLPRFSETGTWRLKWAYLNDNVGNGRWYQFGELTHLGLSAAFEVAASQEDVTTPELVEVTLSVSEVDVSSGSGIITVTARATDDLSGISHLELAFESPSGEQEERMSASVPTTGTFSDGLYVDTMTLPRFSETGTWQLKWAYLNDNVGNGRWYQFGELTHLGLSASFEVATSQEDVTTPELIEVTLSVSELDVSSGSGIITVTARATDDLSGISHLELAFESPSGEQEERMSASVPTTGTFSDGLYVDTMTLPRFSETGTWQLKWAYLNDNVGNGRWYQFGELTHLGLSASFEVVGQ